MSLLDKLNIINTVHYGKKRNNITRRIGLSKQTVYFLSKTKMPPTNGTLVRLKKSAFKCTKWCTQGSNLLYHATFYVIQR